MEKFAEEDASVATHSFKRVAHVILQGGGAPKSETSTLKFDVDSGLPISFVIVANMTTSLGDVPVRYDLSWVGIRVSSAVSPVLVDP